MIAVGHLVDAALAWDQRVAVSQLVDRLPTDEFTQHVATLGAVPALRGGPAAVGATVLPCLGAWSAINGSFVRRFGDAYSVDVWHTWSVAAAASAVATGKPVVLDVSDPVLDARSIKRIRALAARPCFAVSCASQIVRRRLIEGGVPLTTTAVVRPGINFAAINRFRRSAVRRELGMAREDVVFVCPQRLSRADGHLDACLAACMLNLVHGNIKMILPGQSVEQRRIARVAQGLPVAKTLYGPTHRYPTEQLIAIADALVIVPRGDIATTSIAWAMASETVVIGTATYAVAELISNGVNGVLFKQEPGRRMVTDIARRIMARQSFPKLRETARGQAYEVFSLRRYAEQIAKLYRNTQAGTAADTGITDPAMVA